MATATQNSTSQNSEVENPEKTLTLDTSNLPDLTDKSSPAIVSPTGNTASTNDIEKKVRRAERFGVPVQLSEQEKRSSRAERFGVGAGSEASKTSEDLKRKARAERFGLSLSADEEAKKKARLARFGSDTKAGSDTKTGSDAKTDTLEEEKRKARALRFSHSSSNAVQHINGKEDVNSNSAIAGNAVEGV